MPYCASHEAALLLYIYVCVCVCVCVCVHARSRTRVDFFIPWCKLLWDFLTHYVVWSARSSMSSWRRKKKHFLVWRGEEFSQWIQVKFLKIGLEITQKLKELSKRIQVVVKVIFVSSSCGQSERIREKIFFYKEYYFWYCKYNILILINILFALFSFFFC